MSSEIPFKLNPLTNQTKWRFFHHRNGWESTSLTVGPNLFESIGRADTLPLVFLVNPAWVPEKKRSQRGWGEHRRGAIR